MLAVPALLIGVRPTPASAQETISDNPVTARDVFESAHAAYGPPAPKPRCNPQEGEEIVVCGSEPDDPNRYRIPSRLDDGDDSHLEKDIRAPDFAPPPCVPSLLTLCPKFGNPPPPAYLVDFSALPEAPPGSDADRVGRGLAPTTGGASVAAADPRASAPQDEVSEPPESESEAPE